MEVKDSSNLIGRGLISVLLTLLVITAFHYSTPSGLHWLHGIYRRLYYVPIVLGALRFGFKGGVL
ncbi:MAG: hypothetical protein D6808_06950, partial [Candidatus Dadabacteria bacterium]